MNDPILAQLNSSARKTISGIYQIKNVVNGMLYIGSAVYLSRRKSEHLNDLRDGVHHCAHLQNAFSKYGKENFVFTVIEECARENLIAREQYHIDRIGIKNLYNILPTAGSPLGTKHSAETRAKIGAGNRGKVMSPEARAKCSAWQVGRKLSSETRARISASGLGRKFSAEHSAKKSAAQMKPVQQIDKVSREVLATFDSVKSAWLETGVGYSDIATCCRGKRKSAGGFHWRYL